MRIAGAIQVLIVLCLVLTWSSQQVQAGSALTSIHKVTPESPVHAGSRSLILLRPTDVDLIKRKPGRVADTRVAAGQAALLERRISARTAVVVDARTGRMLFALSPDVPRQPASTIKVITGMIAINSLRDSQMVRASYRAAGMPRSKIHLQPGRSYRAGDLINATLLRSANDAAVALAEEVAGSEKAFARLMTSKVRSLGAGNTVLRNASGLTAVGQQSTARDLALIFHRAMQNQEFAQRVGSASVGTALGQTLRATNRALWQIDGAKGGKTGFTRAAQQTYVGKFRRGNFELVIALMGSNTMWDDIDHLVEFGFSQLRSGKKLADARVDQDFTRRDSADDAVEMIVLSNVAKTSL